MRYNVILKTEIAVMVYHKRSEVEEVFVRRMGPRWSFAGFRGFRGNSPLQQIAEQDLFGSLAEVCFGLANPSRYTVWIFPGRGAGRHQNMVDEFGRSARLNREGKGRENGAGG